MNQGFVSPFHSIHEWERETQFRVRVLNFYKGDEIDIFLNIFQYQVVFSCLLT